MLSLLAATAYAATLVVLPLDGRGLDAEQADLATETLRDALTATGTFEVPRGTALTTALTAGHESELKNAREAFAAGKALAAKGSTKSAVTELESAVRNHLAAGSAIARRGELADTLWALAETRLRLGDTLGARDDLTGVAHVWPGYTTTRLHGSGGTAAKMVAEIEAGVARERWHVDEDAVATAFSATEAEAVVTGALGGNGALVLHVVRTGGEDTVLDETVTLPVDTIGDEWAGIAVRVSRAATGAKPAARTPEPDEPEAEREVEPVERPARKPAVDKPVTIREVRPTAIADGPVTTRWWFWTAIVGVVGGGTALGVVLAEPAPVVTVHEAPVYTVSVPLD